MAAVIAQMTLDTERIDRHLLAPEPLQQAEDAGAVFLVADLPRHIVVVDSLGMRGMLARRLIGDLQRVEAQRLGEDGVADLARLGIDRLVDHVPGIDLIAEMPGHAGDVGAQPFFGAGRAHALGQRGRDIFAVVPQQRMPAQLHLVVAGIGGDRVGRPEIQGVRVVAEHIDLHLVLRHHDGAFARDDRAIGRIVDRRGPTGIDRGSEQDALGRRQIAQRNITLRHQSRRERSHHQAAGHPDKLLPTGHRRALPLGFHHPLLVLCNDICMAPRKRQGHGEAGEFGQSSRRASPQVTGSAASGALSARATSSISLRPRTSASIMAGGWFKAMGCERVSRRPSP